MQKQMLTQTHVRRLVMDAMLIALYVVFKTQLSIVTPIMKISPFVSLPILLCARLYGLRDALVVAFVGSLVEQVTSPYGISVSTLIWMAPVIFQAAFAAILFWLLCRREGRLRLLIVVILSELFLTVLNVLGLYLDGYIMQYAVEALDVIAVPRLLNCLARTVISCILFPMLLPPLGRLARQKKHHD